ncbi:glycosyltransferase family 4 protein [Austwickia chelonae]|uniref:glycosyltransferase family 4 protein n=1 Tax=Austwickia chelonae TaxID=100225 RepID=UPI0013C374FB|nr:glycosyltransferase family 4 protein [Austwickia chelonae]
MKVGFVTQYYTPERGAAALPGVIASALARRGHEVKVVTAFPNYPDSQVYAGYQQSWHRQEEIEGVIVHRAPHYLSHDDRALRRIGTYSTFAATATVHALRHLKDVDAVWVHSSPATAAAPAMALRARFGIPYVLHIQDIWPETVTASGFVSEGTSRKLEAGIHPFTDRTYRLASSVQVTSPGMINRVRLRGIPEEKIGFIPNWCNEGAFRPLPCSASIKDELGIDRPFTVMYAGAMGEVQGLDTVLDAASLLRDQTEIGFALIGTGVARPRLEERVHTEDIPNVRFIDPQPFEQMAEVMSAAEMQLIILKDLPVYRLTLPSKTQATMSAGQPMLVSAAGDIADIVDRYATGITCTPGSAQALADAVMRSYNATPETRALWASNARRAYEEHFCEERGVAAIESALEAAVTKSLN